VTGDERDVLAYAAARLDEIREHLEAALAASAPAIVYVRLALIRDDDEADDE